MITCVVAICHAFRTNARFNPELLYLGALIADVSIAQVLVEALL